MKYVLYVLAFVMCCINCVAQTYIEPVFDRADVPSLHINKIEVTKDTTFVYCTYTAEAGSWARISKDTYLYDHDKKKKYTILKCSGLPFSPQQRDFRFEESVQIVFFFPSIGNATKFDFIEDPSEDAFNIYGINLKEQYEYVYKITDMEHFSRMSSMFDISGNASLTIQYKKKEFEAAKYLVGIKSLDYFSSLMDLCKLYDKYGFHQESIDMGDTIKQIFEPLQIQLPKYANFLCKLSNLYSDGLNYEKAILLQETACQIYEKESDWLSLAESYNGLGELYKDKRDLDRAEQCARNALGVLYKHGKAEEYVQKEIELSGNYLFDNPDYYNVINDRILIDKSAFYGTLSRILREKGDIAEAIKVQKESLEVLKELSDVDLFISNLGQLAMLYRENGQYEESIDCEKKCLAFEKSRGNMEHVSMAQYQLSISYFEKGDTIRAIGYADEAVLTSRSIGDKLEIAEGLGFLSILYWKSSKYEEAEKCLSEALDYIQIMLQPQMKEMTSEQKQRIWNKYRNLFFLYRNLVYKGGMDGEKTSKLYDYVLFSKSLLLDSETFGEEFTSKRLNVTWKDIQKKLSDEDIAVEFIATQEEVTERMTYFIYHALVIDKDSRCPKMVTLIHDKGVENGTEHVSMLWNPILDQYKEVRNIYFSPDGVMHELPIENLYVDSIGFLSDKYNLYRLSSTKELVKPHKESRIENVVLYGGLSYSNEDVPDLAIAEGARANLLRGIKERGGFDPLYSTSSEIYIISRLLEQNNIRTTLYMNENGTEDSFRKLTGADIDLIHLATHGMFVENENVIQRKEENNFVFMESLNNKKDPVYENTLLTHSFLVMSGGNKMLQRETATEKSNDGILTAQEISELDLSGIDMVVLSACETAKGDLTMDGILGLPWGFKKAGVNTILMSLDKVDDEATKILMVEFYKNLMSGKSKLQSLKDAQKYLREYDNGKYDKPEYWASFIMLDGLD